ncbi:MAG: ferritin-like domain-containing protein [Christensenellales bacterium]|jgi:bacterioferritin
MRGRDVVAEPMMDSAAKYRVDLPYPESRNLKKNRRFARILLNDYAGKTSEMTAIAQYVYQHMILKRTYPEVADALMGIAVTEMHHLDLLGEAIFGLGVLPKYRTIQNERPFWWSGAEVDYEKTLRYILTANVEAEEAAIYEYQNTIRMINDPSIVALIRRIILDEELHVDIFNALIKKYL